MTAKFIPPKCPGCGKPLKTVYERSHETYQFHPESGGYSEDPWGSMDIECPDCGADLRDIFEEGACNYTSTEHAGKGKKTGKKGKRHGPGDGIISMRT